MPTYTGTMEDAIPFLKMHGLGNDFVVLDARQAPLSVAPALARAIADRHGGIGCDQLILLEPATRAGADVFMRILNADGGEAGACGNATRCVASLLMAETGRPTVTVETLSGLLPAARHPTGQITVDMGEPRLAWHEIPLARAANTLHVPTGIAELADAACTSMGNPHATFFVADADAVDLPRLGPLLEHHALFPARANIGVASLLGPNRLRLRVWERGAGLTLACGSGACAAMVAAARREITGRRAEIVMERGSLSLDWGDDGHVRMTGPAALSFAGSFRPADLAGAA